jgi:NADPH-dependent ferric siderophore reductase
MVRARREPRPFRRVTVRRVEHVSPRMVRFRLGGRDVEGLTVAQPAASVRLLLPSPGGHGLVIPTWNGNEFLLPDGRRPTFGTFTPRRVDPDAAELDLEIVIHSGGLASQWTEPARRSHPAAVSGPGRGYTVDPCSKPYPRRRRCRCTSTSPTVTLGWRGVTVRARSWRGGTYRRRRLLVMLVAAVGGANVVADTRVWVAGEAAGLPPIGGHLFADRGLPRLAAWVGGHCKHDRRGDADAGDDA